MARIAIIAAMHREVAPLIRSWKVRTIEHASRQYRLFENGEASLICGGIGSQAARRATEAVIQAVHPVRVISVGFAGALPGSLNPSLHVGDILEPRAVINVADGVRTDLDLGQGILLTSVTMADTEQKARLGRAYGASAVDMEAAAVAQGAQARSVEFAALKVISDDANFNLPALERFVADDGTFRSASFAAYVALRPWLWKTTIVLARNSYRASKALCAALASYLARTPNSRPGRESFGSPVNQTGVNLAELEACAGEHTGTGIQAHTRATGKS